MAAKPLVWVVTGAFSGFGAALLIHVLKEGHKVIATARDAAKAAKSYTQVSSLGGKWIVLDVTSPAGAKAVDDAVRIFGKIDVLCQ